MPVDFLPVLLAIVTVVALGATLVVAPGRTRPGIAWAAGLAITLLFPLAYVWLYHSTALLHGAAAERGEAASQYALGASYMHYRRGSPHDPYQGEEFLRMAAEQDYLPAQMTLGARHLWGLSVRQSPKEAHLWFTRARDLGNEDARILVGIIDRGDFDPTHPTGPAADLLYEWLD